MKRHEKRMVTTYTRMMRCAMGVSLPEHRSNEEILQEVKVEPIAMDMVRIGL